MPTHRQVASHWARKTKPSSKGYAMFFEGPRIYSWGRHFCIARHVEHNGRHAVLFTRRDYSTSTAGHKSMTRNAIPHDVPVFLVLDPRRDPLPEDVHAYRDAATDLLKRADRARVNGDFLREQAGRVIAERKAFIKFFGL